MTAAMAARVCATVTLLMFVAGSQAMDLLRATATSGNLLPTPTLYCWCASYPNLTLCSWPEPESGTKPIDYIATYSERHRQLDTKQGQLLPPGSTPLALISASSSSDKLWHLHLPNLKLLTDYIINVTAVYPSGSSSHLRSFMLEDIVKPDPPVHVRVSPHHVRTLLVEWSPPPTWANLHIIPLKYQLLYQWEHRGTPKTVNLGPFEDTKVELKGLMSGRTYLFQVCAKELLGLGECSAWSSPVNITIPSTKL